VSAFIGVYLTQSCKMNLRLVILKLKVRLRPACQRPACTRFHARAGDRRDSERL